MFKYVAFCMLFLMHTLLFIPNTVIIAVEYSKVTNESVDGMFTLSHSVSRVSFFKTMVETADIKTSGTTKLGRFFVRNNTRDGFSVSITSDQEGSMVPSGTSPENSSADGEVPIPYSLKIVKEGDIGTGIDTDYEHTSTDLANPVSVLSIAGDAVSSGTDAEFSLFVEVVDDGQIMDMAGTYSDTLTITYTDQ